MRQNSNGHHYKKSQRSNRGDEMHEMQTTTHKVSSCRNSEASDCSQTPPADGSRSEWTFLSTAAPPWRNCCQTCNWNTHRDTRHLESVLLQTTQRSNIHDFSWTGSLNTPYEYLQTFIKHEHHTVALKKKHTYSPIPYFYLPKCWLNT